MKEHELIIRLPIVESTPENRLGSTNVEIVIPMTKDSARTSIFVPIRNVYLSNRRWNLEYSECQRDEDRWSVSVCQRDEDRWSVSVTKHEFVVVWAILFDYSKMMFQAMISLRRISDSLESLEALNSALLSKDIIPVDYIGNAVMIVTKFHEAEGLLYGEQAIVK